ncbi:MAG TPA: PEP-CTERM sorting domain-containing protein [Planctomycetota bacterium]|nr:PEP-CTERM sorting domain-containing protein [Planctomycetota bacterium]
MKTRVLLVAVLVAMACGPAVADWMPQDGCKMHYPQLPDLDNGMNVLCTERTSWGSKLLADDFLCTGTGLIRDIHIWGSWLNDDDPGFLDVDLYIFSDIPAVVDASGQVLEHSRPEKVLWSRHFTPTEVIVGEVITNPEPFYDPNLNQIIGTDTKIVQYNFFIPEADAFFQENGTIYWLGVQKRNDFDTYVFGWKSSKDHWNDDAVYIDFVPDNKPGLELGEILLDWSELIDPRTLESMDLSFVITPEPTTLALAALGGGVLAVLRRRRLKR